MTDGACPRRGRGPHPRLRRRSHLRTGGHVRRARPRRGTATARRASSTNPTDRSSGTTATSAAGTSGSTRSRASRPSIFNVDPLRYEHMRPGCYDVHERVRDMSAGGQLAGLNFPNWTGFSGQVLNQGPDRDVNLVMIKAYNDWHVDEWCGAYPERFIPCGILPLFDVHEAAREVHRLAAKGCHAVTFSENPAGPRHAEHPHRRVGPAVRRVLRDGDRAVLSRRLVVEERVDVARRAAAGADEPVVGDGDLHARRSAVGRLLASLPAAAVRAHRRRHRLDPVLPVARRAHARPPQRLDAPRRAAGPVADRAVPRTDPVLLHRRSRSA